MEIPCNQLSAPINITNNVTECQTTCNFQPNYNTTTISYQNYGTYLSIKLANYNSSILFNNISYTVSEIRIFSQSLHEYFNERTEGEILIIHTRNDITSYSELLVVSIPITTGLLNNNASTNLQYIIEQAAVHTPLNSLSSANSSGSISTSPVFTLNTLNFNLNDFVPQTVYYYYNGIFSFQNMIGNCSIPSNIIVYAPNNASIAITTDTYNILTDLLSLPNIEESQLHDVTSLFFNKNGPQTHVEEEIYIDCQPVNKSTDEVMVPLTDTTSDVNLFFQAFNNATQSPALQALVGVIVMSSLACISTISFRSWGKYAHRSTVES